MYHIILFILLIVVPAIAIRADRYEALHGYFSTRPSGDPAMYLMIGIGFLTLFIIMTVYHFIHILMMKHYHKKTMRENEETLDKILEHNYGREKKQ